MLTNDSPAEQRGVELAFGGSNAGEREVTHLLCVFHSQQTLKQRLGGPACKEAHRHLTAALRWRTTGAGVEDLFEMQLTPPQQVLPATLLVSGGKRDASGLWFIDLTLFCYCRFQQRCQLKATTQH